jgi:geranylgeranyl diphosphate synthase type I
MQKTRSHYIKKDQSKSKQTKLGSQIQELFEKKGKGTFEKVQKAIFEENIECQEVQDALEYFLSYRRSGFFVRPTLISLGCEAVGGYTNAVLDVAVPLVLMSGGMDIHDDILDNQKSQDSRLTVLGRFNKDVALLAGDALLFKGLMSWHELVKEKLSIQRFIEITRLLQKAFFEVGDGQALEISLKRKADVDPERYRHIVKKKAADIEALLRIGAIIGNASRDEIKALGEYGRCLGMLWILGDDVADMFNHKELKRRIKNTCLPLPLFYALENPKFKSQLHEIIFNKKITRKDTETILQMTTEAAGLEKTKKIMRDLISKALKGVKRFKNAEKLKLLVRDSLNFVSQI